MGRPRAGDSGRPLATESPLLVIGAHGSAKTLVLTRLAEVLALEHRHYNASLLNFDDLIGFPVPEAGKLVYLQTPATIWSAESVFFEEVSRCRPDLQNKLFPIVHERRVQGVALDKLRHRWAAMNPPPNVDGQKDDGFEYAGAEPLDVALADRFAFIVNVPDLKALSRVDQIAVLAADDGAGPSADAAARLKAIVEVARSNLAPARARLAALVGEYVPLVAQKLAQAKHPISTRRAVQIARNIEALAAVFEACGEKPEPDDAFYVALRHSVPDAAWGSPIEAPALLAIHRAAWDVARMSDVALKAVFSEEDPVPRIALALRTPTMSATERGQVVADSYAALDRVGRLATAAFLMPCLGARSSGRVAGRRRSRLRRYRRPGQRLRRRPERRLGLEAQHPGPVARVAQLANTPRRGAREHRGSAAARRPRVHERAARARGGSRGGVPRRTETGAACTQPEGGGVMTGDALLHNMSVPSRSTVSVRRLALRGARFSLDLELAANDLAAFRKGGAAALPRLVEPKTMEGLARKSNVPPGDPGRLFDAWMLDALDRARVPNRIGVFAELDDDPDKRNRLPRDAALAVLATMTSCFTEYVYLTRRSNGTFTVKLHRDPGSDPGYWYRYRSRPFRTGKALLESLKQAEPETASESFAYGEVLEILDAVAELDAALASEARALLGDCDWSEWSPDMVTSIRLRPLADRARRAKRRRMT